jgi:hypothetical protein
VITRSQRQQLVRGAERWRGTSYDFAHSDNLGESPRDTDDVRLLHDRVPSRDGSPRVLARGVGGRRAVVVNNLVEIPSPQPGDLVGCGRPAVGDKRESYDVVWHVMLYAGNGCVLGACEVTGKVTTRSMEYERDLDARQWHLIEAPSFRALTLK